MQFISRNWDKIFSQDVIRFHSKYIYVIHGRSTSIIAIRHMSLQTCTFLITTEVHTIRCSLSPELAPTMSSSVFMWNRKIAVL
jgi:hypothetical protein